MNTRKEITRKYAIEYKRASKKAKGQMLDHLIATIGWSRANARRALVAALVGEFIRTSTVTDVFTGWTENMAIKNSAHRWVIEAMEQIQARLPFALVGLDTDNGSEFINHALINWAGDRNIYFTRSRPYKSNDNAHVEQKNGDVVRRHTFYHRYDTALELGLLNYLYLTSESEAEYVYRNKESHRLEGQQAWQKHPHP